MFGTAGTCSARTCRSGSATVISAPRTKHSRIGRAIPFAFPRDAPIPCPIGVMERSTPSVNIPIPMIRRNAPKEKRTITPGANGAIVTLSSSTMAVMGRTENRDSLIFSMSCGLICTDLLLSAAGPRRQLFIKSITDTGD